VPDNAYYDGAQTDTAIAKLAELNARNKPFFFGIGYYRPHLPFNVPKKYWDLYDRASLPLSPNPFLPKNAPIMAGNVNRELRGYRDFNNAPRPHEGSVSYIDAQIGRLLDELDRLKIRDNTIVVLWGDHGWKLGDHNSWGKMTNYEIDTRVPLILRVPGMGNGKSCAGLVEFVDLYPTLCDLCDVPKPAVLEGVSFRRLLHDPNRKGKSAVFSQYLRNGIWTAPDGVEYMGYAIRTESHRYVEWFRWKDKQLAATELYDLRRDPLENECLQGHAELRGQLSQRLHKAFKI
jgi:arylsulfatase A-like enzyme